MLFGSCLLWKTLFFISLAVLLEASDIAISGAESAYFPTNRTCLHTLAFTETQTEQLNNFLKELGEQGINSANRDKEADCIICG
ncbi:hypothetical protein llap_12279 [Limosa lapponica baueri]|uniref:Uncharacterized protein n=1 Tax=Limosa lapponica baueri TaxID=1758121 RepID=A0A2I0TUD5_LIMLA|nr:hypothetical protein llap_12279 [Limosa lapponica baueri]